MGRETYNRPNKPILILLKPLQRILRISRPLDNLPRHVVLPLNALRFTLALGRDVVEDIPQLVRRGRLSRDLELELGALVLGVVGVVGGLVLGGRFGGDGRGLFEDGEGVGGRGEGWVVEERDRVDGFGLFVVLVATFGHNVGDEN